MSVVSPTNKWILPWNGSQACDSNLDCELDGITDTPAATRCVQVLELGEGTHCTCNMLHYRYGIDCLENGTDSYIAALVQVPSFFIYLGVTGYGLLVLIKLYWMKRLRVNPACMSLVACILGSLSLMTWPILKHIVSFGSPAMLFTARTAMAILPTMGMLVLLAAQIIIAHSWYGVYCAMKGEDSKRKRCTLNVMSWLIMIAASFCFVYFSSVGQYAGASAVVLVIYTAFAIAFVVASKLIRSMVPKGVAAESVSCMVNHTVRATRQVALLDALYVATAIGFFVADILPVSIDESIVVRAPSFLTMFAGAACCLTAVPIITYIAIPLSSSRESARTSERDDIMEVASNTRVTNKSKFEDSQSHGAMYSSSVVVV